MVRIENENDEMVAYLSGDIDHHSAKSIREQIDSEVTQMSVKKLTLDFKDVTFMDSSGIGLVMGRYKLLKSQNGTIAIANCSIHIKKVMKLAGLDKLTEFE